MPTPVRSRPRSTLVTVLLLWAVFYFTWTLWTPALLDDADSVHAEVAREMLLRQDPVTLYANGIRYLEKAPLLYWSMALAMKAGAALGAESARAMGAAVRVPLALAVLALALVCEALARRIFSSARAGWYAAMVTLSSFGIFLFSRITLPDVYVCLWLAVAMLAWFRMQAAHEEQAEPTRGMSALFGLACALGVLSKGLIGLLFPLLIVAVHLLAAHGWRQACPRLRERHVWVGAAVFLAVAAPWHIAAGLANPTVGHPDAFRFANGHWQVPLPTDGNVRGWFWFYFMNEHVLRYLNLRVPRDYDTSPLWLFWGLCVVWMMPWSAFAFKAFARAVSFHRLTWRSRWKRHELPLRERGALLAACWAAVVLLFFSLSTRQEYYVLPALPAAAVLIAGWLAHEDRVARSSRITAKGERTLRAGRTIALVLACFGVLFAVAGLAVLAGTRTPPPGTDLADLLRHNPNDYALSMGHFLDLDTGALGMFRLPLIPATIGFGIGGPAAWMLRRRLKVFASNVVLLAASFAFLLSAHLGLRTFAPVLTSAQLAEAIAPQVMPCDVVMIHGEYESGSTLGFYLRRDDVHILEGRSSNLWYGSFFPDAPKIFETPASVAAEWHGARRIFLWQSLTDPPAMLPAGLEPVYVLARSGGKEIVSNRPTAAPCRAQP